MRFLHINCYFLFIYCFVKINWSDYVPIKFGAGLLCNDILKVIQYTFLISCLIFCCASKLYQIWCAIDCETVYFLMKKQAILGLLKIIGEERLFSLIFLFNAWNIIYSSTEIDTFIIFFSYNLISRLSSLFLSLCLSFSLSVSLSLSLCLF